MSVIQNSGSVIALPESPLGADTSFFGTIAGGTIVNANSVGIAGEISLAGVVWDGPLVIGNDSYSASIVTLDDPNALQPNADGTRVVAMTAFGGAVGFVNGTNTLMNDDIQDDAPSGGVLTDGTLVLGATSTIDVVGGPVPASTSFAVAQPGFTFGYDNDGSGTYVNDGVIRDTAGSGNSVILQGASFANAGTIQIAGAGNSLAWDDGALSNTGTISISNGATLLLDDAGVDGFVDAEEPFANTGEIIIDASSTIVAGLVSAQQIQGFDDTGAALVVNGDLINSGTIDLAPGGAFGDVTLDGTVLGGTVVNQGGMVNLLTADIEGTWAGPLALVQPNVTVAVEALAGLGTAPEVVTIAGTSDLLTITTTAGSGGINPFSTLANTTIDIGATGGTTTLVASAGLIIGAGSTIAMTQPGAGPISLLGRIVNQGVVDDQSGNLLIQSATLASTLFPVSPPFDDTSVFDNQGTLILAAGSASTATVTANVYLSNEGVIQVDRGDTLNLQAGRFTNTGTLAIGAGTVAIAGDFAGTLGTVAFTPNEAGTLILQSPGTADSATFLNVSGNDKIEFGDGSTITAVVMTQPGTAAVTTTIGTVSLSGFPTAGVFVFGTDAATGDTYFTVTCFAQGTRIATPDGERAIETLCLGDLVTCRDMPPQPIIWIGRRDVDCARHPKPAVVWPVRVAAGAFGKDYPSRDLYLSPDHAIYSEDVLSAVKYLIDGHAIRQVPRATVTYYHIELSRHAVILAEGLPVESYLDTGDRDIYTDQISATDRNPDHVALTWEAHGYAPLTVTGLEVQRARARIAAARVAEAA